MLSLFNKSNEHSSKSVSLLGITMGAFFAHIPFGFADTYHVCVRVNPVSITMAPKACASFVRNGNGRKFYCDSGEVSFDCAVRSSLSPDLFQRGPVSFRQLAAPWQTAHNLDPSFGRVLKKISPTDVSLRDYCVDQNWVERHVPAEGKTFGVKLGLHSGSMDCLIPRPHLATCNRGETRLRCSGEQRVLENVTLSESRAAYAPRLSLSILK